LRKIRIQPNAGKAQIVDGARDTSTGALGQFLTQALGIG